MKTSTNIPTIWLVYSAILLILAIHYQTLSFMAYTWNNDSTFTHGFFIFPISFWIIWKKKHPLNNLNRIPEPKALVLIIIMSFCWYIANITGIQVVMQFSLIAIILSTVLTIFGRSIFRLLLFPLLFLFLAVPFGKALIPILMEFTANFTVLMVKVLGVPIYQDGLTFTLPTGKWSVVEACSGLNYLIASITLGVLYSYLTYSKFYKRSIFVFSIIIISILANGFRAFGIVMIGHLSKLQYGTGDDHTFYGWLFYGFIIFLVFYIGNTWSDPITDDINSSYKPQNNTPKKIYKNESIAGLIALLIIILPITVVLLPNESRIPQISLMLPVSFNEWQHTLKRELEWKPYFKNPDNNARKTYQFGEDILQLSIAYYAEQRQGAEAISSTNSLTNKNLSNWRISSNSEFQTDSIYIKESELSNPQKKILIWSWYKVGDYVTPNPYIAKLLEIYNKVFKQRTDISIYVIATFVSEGKNITRLKLEKFVTTNRKALDNITAIDQ